MKIFQLAAAAVIATSTIITAQPNVEPITCTCTPNAYILSLNFDGTCPGSTEGSDGIDGSICFFTQGGSPDELDDSVLGLNAGLSAVPPTRRRLGNAAVEKNEEWVDTVLSKVDFTNHIQHASAVHATRQLQTTTPTKITSVTFLETDTTPDLNIINQDSTYFDIDGSDGDILEYTSISSTLDPFMPIGDQLDKVPGGVILVLFGENAAGEVIQNRVAWGFKRNYCNEEPVAVGMSIGWQSLDGYSPASPNFCDAVKACPSEDGTGTIVEVLAGNEDFSTLVTAVTAAGLVDTLSGDGPFTVFAPTNEAFAALPEGSVEALLLPENIDILTEILTYHIVAADLPSNALDTGSVPTINGAEVDVVVSDDGITVNGANVIIADVQACNGVIHVIDAVLLPPQSPPATTTEAPPSEPTTVAPPMTTEATPLPPATTDGPTFSKSSKSKSEKATTKSSKTENMSMPSAKSKKGDTKSSKLMKAVSHLAAISDEMEQTLNESSSVIEALVTLTSGEDSDKSTAETVDDEDI